MTSQINLQTLQNSKENRIVLVRFLLKEIKRVFSFFIPNNGVIETIRKTSILLSSVHTN